MAIVNITVRYTRNVPSDTHHGHLSRNELQHDLGHGLTLGHISRGAVSGFCCPFPDADMGLTRSHGFFKRPAVFCIWFQSQVTHSHLERTQQ